MVYRIKREIGKETLFDRVRNHADNVEIRRWDRMDRTLDTENIKRGGIRIISKSTRLLSRRSKTKLLKNTRRNESHSFRFLICYNLAITDFGSSETGTRNEK